MNHELSGQTVPSKPGRETVPETAEILVSSKVEGKKRALDEEGEVTATEDESQVTEKSVKRRKTQSKQ